jgi:hypothetical protein
VKNRVETQQLLALALHETGDRNAGPSGDDLGDLLFGDLLAQQCSAVAVGPPLAASSSRSRASSCGSSPCFSSAASLEVVGRSASSASLAGARSLAEARTSWMACFSFSY